MCVRADGHMTFDVQSPSPSSRMNIELNPRRRRICAPRSFVWRWSGYAGTHVYLSVRVCGEFTYMRV